MVPELETRITTYGGELYVAGYRTVQHWQLYFGDTFIADTSAPHILAVWLAKFNMTEDDIG